MRWYRNPVLADGDFGDPFILRFNGRYFLYCTHPEVVAWTSSDLIHWEPAGPTVAPEEVKGRVPFAPEVVYANGWFYMYTSPSGFGHVVLRASDPLGPFRRVTGNLGRQIDGTVFVDEDGSRYFYWAGWEGVWACEMVSPTELGEPTLTGAFMNGWTEGPSVIKRDGRYVMMLTGNHFMSPGYRVDIAVSESPLTGFTRQNTNPALLRTSGTYVGLGPIPLN